MPKRAPVLNVLPKRKATEQDRQARRALATNSGAWLAIRVQVLREEPLCRECAKHGRIKASSQVDHIDGDSTHDERSNWQALCATCHSRKTVAENGGFGNRKRGGGVESLSPRASDT